MKKSLSIKTINGKQYAYLNFRRNGKLESQYVGPVTGAAFKRYLMRLMKESEFALIEKAKRENFKNGLPIAYGENGKLCREYLNGAVEEVEL